jgi:cytoskeletal protein RodZ
MNKKPPHEDDSPRAESAVERDGESFGIWLRRQREGRGIELEEIAKTSKIGMTYLRAFEEERFSILPATIFAKGFLRQYALYVGLDPEEVVNFYLQSIQDVDGEDRETTSVGQVRASARSNLPWVIFSVALLLIMVFWGYSWSSGKTFEPSGSIPQADSLPPGAPQPTEVRLPVDGPTDEPPVEPPGVEEVAVVPTESRFPLRVVLDFSEECWVEAYVDGRQETVELKIQGESLLLEADEVIELKIGNIDAVSLEVNEHPYLVEGSNGAVQNLRIDLASVRQRAKVSGEMR